MLKFEDLTSTNWLKYEKFVLHSEIVFQKPIRNSSEEYLKVISLENSICKIALLDSKYIGNIIGFCPTKKDILEEGLKDVKEDHNMIYMFNFVIEPEYQNKGYGSQLLNEFIKSAKEKKYKKLLGHFRPNSSLYLLKKLGAEEKKTYKNWWKTKEDYTLCKLML